jgi:hypothetical protein
MRALARHLGAGFAFGGALVGGVCTVIALFNLIVRSFDLSLNPLTAPLIESYRSITSAIFNWAKATLELPLPSWPHDHIVLYFAAAAVFATLNADYRWPDDEIPNHLKVIAKPATMLGLTFALFVPYLNLFFLISLYAVFVVTALWPAFIWYQSKEARAHVAPRGLYVWGICAGVAAALLFNWLY